MRILAMVLALLVMNFGSAWAQDGAGHAVPLELLWIPLILVAAKLAGMIERWGQPAVLGELVIGMILGNLILVGIPVLEPIKTNAILAFLAELGVVLLLFQIGLESNLGQLTKVGPRAGAVAILGVVLPFVLGTYIVGPMLMPGQSLHAYLFMGAAMTATSVGITARVFKDLGVLQMPEAQIVLGAAVIDDVLGLIILAVVSAMVTAGSVSAGAVAVIFVKSLLFLVAAVGIGMMLAPRLGALFSRIQTGAGMKLTLALALAFFTAYLAGVAGLAPIVGAFAAGLVLDPVHFRSFREPEMVEEVRVVADSSDASTRGRLLGILEHHSHRHVEDLIEPIAYLLVPLFFVLTGMGVSLEALFDIPVLLVALGLTVAAFLGKLAAGIAAGPVNKWIVGWGMVPRGEVGLIFATIGRGLGVVSEEVFSVILLVVIFTTLVPPPILNHLLKKAKAEGKTGGGDSVAPSLERQEATV